MASVTRHRMIPATSPDIWEVLADFGDLARWVPDIDHSELTTRPVGAADDHGDVIDRGLDPASALTRRVQTGRIVLLEHVALWDPPHAMTYEIQGLPRFVQRAQNSWRIDPVGPSCDVSITSTVSTGSRPPSAALAKVVCRVLAKVSDQLLDGLATEMKGRAHG